MNKTTRILVVDDDPAGRDFYSMVLRAEGYEVCQASTGEEGLQAAREQRPDLVLLDVVLPDLNGMEVCNKIKAEPGLPGVFVALFSGHPPDAARELYGPAAGADDYILKTDNREEFRARIRSIVLLRDTTMALRTSEEHYRQLAEHIREVFWLTDVAKNQMVYISPAYEEIWGRTCESLYASPRDWADAIHPEDRARVLDAAVAKQVSGQYDEVYRIVRPDGVMRWIQDRAFPIRNQAGEVYRIAGIAEDITERRQAELLLREAEAKYHGIFENAIEGIFQTTPEGRYLSANPALAQILGYASPEELIASITDLDQQLCVEPETRRELRRRLETEGAVRQFENQIYRKDGTKIWIRVNARVVRDARGAVLYYEGTSEDITESKRAAAELATLAHGVESTSEPISITDLHDRFTFINRAFQHTYGYAPEEILGQTPAILFSARNPPALLAEILKQTRAGGWRGEVWDRRKDGSEFPIFLSTSQIKDQTGRVVGLMGVAQDITERKQAEEQIHLLADAVQSTQELICITDPENRFTFVNRAFLATYGYQTAEILGRTPDFLYSPRNPPGLPGQVFQQTLAGGWHGEVLNCKKDGTEFPISLSTSQIKNTEGRIIGLIGVARDISERRRAEKQRAAFAQLGHRLSAATAPEQAANIVLEIASDLFGWDAAYVHLYSAAEQRIVRVVTIDTVGGRRVPVPAPRSSEPTPFMRLIMKEGARLINREKEAPVDPNLVPFGDKHRRSAALMYVPVRSSGGARGILSIQSYTPQAYSQEDLRLLQALADHCGDALRRIKVAQALREAEAKYRAIIENATEGIFQTTPDGCYLSANPALARMLGYATPTELMSSVTNIERQTYVQPQQRKEFKRLVETQGSVQGFEAERLRKDGKHIWMSVNGHVVRDTRGGILYYEGTNLDITARKRAEEALERSRRLQKAILDNISDPAWLKDTEGRFLACNEAAARFFGLTPAQVLGRTVVDLEPQEAPRLTREDNQVMQSRQPALFEAPRTDAHGHRRWFESFKSPTFNDQGEVTGTVGIAREITERKRAEEELRDLSRRVIEAQEAERLRVARELHDGVNQILASAKMRLRKVEEAVGELSPAAREILARCEQLLVRALEENRRIAHNLRPSDLDHLGLAIACRNFCKELQSRTNLAVNCRITRLSRRLPPAVELGLFRIAQEAINNIEKHARAKTARLRISFQGDSVILKIQDDGRGFGPKHPNAARRKRSGIGLTNMRERAASLGGTCQIVSAQGKGTTITVQVPCQDPAQKAGGAGT